MNGNNKNHSVRFSLAPHRWRSLLRLRRAIRHAQNSQDISVDSPALVVLTDLSAELLAHARALAGDDRQDRKAVSELIELAGDDQRALQIAALGARQGGEHHESYGASLTHRLLQAALADSAVESLTDSQRECLTRLEDFADLPITTRWRQLTELQPRLIDLTGQLSIEQLARHLDTTEVVELPPPQRERILSVRHAARERLRGELASLVGPQSQSDHPLLRSRTALATALTYLMEVDRDESGI